MFLHHEQLGIIMYIHMTELISDDTWMGYSGHDQLQQVVIDPQKHEIYELQCSEVTIPHDIGSLV